VRALTPLMIEMTSEHATSSDSVDDFVTIYCLVDLEIIAPFPIVIAIPV
jgi:hypothetical protein